MTFFNALNEMNRIQRELDRWFDFPFRPINQGLNRVASAPSRTGRNIPRINVFDLGETIQVEALAPGLDPEKMDVSVQGNVLTIQGERAKQSTPTNGDASHRRERPQGRFTRTLELPSDIDRSAVEAEYRNGVLRVTLPKTEKEQPRTIDVKFSEN